VIDLERLDRRIAPGSLLPTAPAIVVVLMPPPSDATPTPDGNGTAPVVKPPILVGPANPV
jgi:hypothetical protein